MNEAAIDSQLLAQLERENHNRQGERLARAYADLVTVFPWQWFCHFTFKPTQTTKHGGVHPEFADKAFRLFVSSINRAIWGPRWAKKRVGGVVWARGQEFHKDGRIHFHAVMAADDDLNQLQRRMDWVDWWFQRFGIARITPPSSIDDCCSYICKYVAKDGEVDLSQNFATYRAIAYAGQGKRRPDRALTPKEFADRLAAAQAKSRGRTK